MNILFENFLYLWGVSASAIENSFAREPVASGYVGKWLCRQLAIGKWQCRLTLSLARPAREVGGLFGSDGATTQPELRA